MKTSCILALLVLLVAFCVFGKPVVPDRKTRITKAFFQEDAIIYTSEHKITNLVIYIKDLDFKKDGDEIAEDEPLLFFNQVDEKPNGETVQLGQFILKNGTAIKLFDGRTAASDLQHVYFGAEDGIYEFKPETISVEKYGTVTQNILQLQKANGTDIIYILTKPDNKIQKVTEKGTKQVAISAISSARGFVLDWYNNIYYYDDDNTVFVLSNATESSTPVRFTGLPGSVEDVSLIRAPFIVEDVALLIADGVGYVLYSNGTVQEGISQIDMKTTAQNLDLGLIQYFAEDGKIYKINIFELFLKAIFQALGEWVDGLGSALQSIFNKSAN